MKKKKHRILIVDDDVSSLYFYQKLLIDDYEVETATLPLDALEMLVNKEHFSVIVSDYRMPEMNGIDFLIRARASSPDSVRAVLSAQSDQDVVIDAVNRSNIYRFITKPCPANLWKKTIADCVALFTLKRSEKYYISRLRKKSDEMKFFASRIVHNLQNPLQVIVGTTEYLIDSELAPNPTVTQLLQGMMRSALMMNHEVKQVLETVRLRGENSQINLIYENPAPIIDKSIMRQSLYARSKKIQFEMNYSELLPEVYFDPAALQDVLENIISNAIKFSHQQSRIRIKTIVAAESLMIIIEDEGLGMTAEDIDAAFIEFRRLSARPTDNELSTGMGLAIVKKLTEAMGGQVGVSSPGKNLGAKFWVELKRAGENGQPLTIEAQV